MRDLQKRKIREIWGNTALAKEIEEFFEEHNLDLFKLIQCCQRKGQHIGIAMGAILGPIKDFDVVVQCDCGEVMGFGEDVYRHLKKLYGNGRIKCKRCDPSHAEKLEKVARLLGYKGSLARFNWHKKR